MGQGDEMKRKPRRTSPKAKRLEREVAAFMAAHPAALDYKEEMATILDVAATAGTEMPLARAFVLAVLLRPLG